MLKNNGLFPRLALGFWAILSSSLAPGLRRYLSYRAGIQKEEKERLAERFGHSQFPRPLGALIHFHGASVGEIISIFPVILAIQNLDPHQEILITTGTVTSAHLVQKWIQETALVSRKIRHQYLPLDVPKWMSNFLHHWYPNLIILTESEIWPNLITQAKNLNIPMTLINAKLSDKTLRSWRILPNLAKTLLQCFDWITARSEVDRHNLIQLGATVDFYGDLKQAATILPVDEKELEKLHSVIKDRPLWVAASTHSGEEKFIQKVHHSLRKEWPSLLTIIIPRHPNRRSEILQQLGSIPLRSQNQLPDQTGLWLCDTLGELGLFYRLSDIVFMGNSLAVTPKGGGHNPFEPARLHCAIATGPRIHNFQTAYKTLASAVCITPTLDSLAKWVDSMLRFSEERNLKAQIALRVSTDNAQLPEQIARHLLKIMR